MGKKEVKEQGWVVVAPSKCIIACTFNLDRSNAINLFKNLAKRWTDYENQGYKCVKAERIIILKE